MIKSVQVDLTTKCNQKCYMCRQYTWNAKEIPFEILKKKIEKYHNENEDCTFTFSGGDPTSYNHIRELNNLIEKLGISHYQLFTNLDFPEMEFDIIKFLNKAEYLQVSMDGYDSKTYAYVRYPGLADNFEERWKNITERVKLYGSKTKLNVTVSNRNYKHISKIYDEFKNDVKNIRFYPVHTNDNALLKKDMFESIKKQMQYILEDDVKEMTNAKTFSLKPMEDYKGFCFIKKDHVVVDQTGKEYPCCRATNDNGEDWEGRYCLDNLNNIDDEKVLYDFCPNCDRYRKFNENYKEKVESKKVVYL